jgi:hypothetical protein
LLSVITRVPSVVLFIASAIVVRADSSDYTYTRAKARKAVLAYCHLDCALAERKLPCCEPFEKAMAGDFAALTLVFTDSDYHSGDNESWDFIAWPLLHAVADKRFAAWLRTLDEKTKNGVFDHVFYAGSYYARAIRAGYFRRKFPEVEAIYRTLQRDDHT